MGNAVVVSSSDGTVHVEPWTPACVAPSSGTVVAGEHPVHVRACGPWLLKHQVVAETAYRPLRLAPPSNRTAEEIAAAKRGPRMSGAPPRVASLKLNFARRRTYHNLPLRAFTKSEASIAHALVWSQKQGGSEPPAAPNQQHGSGRSWGRSLPAPSRGSGSAWARSGGGDSEAGRSGQSWSSRRRQSDRTVDDDSRASRTSDRGSSSGNRFARSSNTSSRRSWSRWG